jgi:hypothetical protein
MTTVSSNLTGSDTLAASFGAYQSQIADLQRQCADWRGCATTPAGEKEKQISALQSQIQTLQQKMAKVEQVEPANAAYDVRDNLTHANNINTADGVNRPDSDPFAISGSVLNVKI